MEDQRPALAFPLRPMNRLLAPRSVAIVGASADPRSFGGFVLGNLERFGWAGTLHLVSRSSPEIGGRACVRDVADLPEGIDVAVLAIPEAGVRDAVRALAARGCHAAVLFASGYAETGEAGRARQQALVEAAGAMALVGPNCMGYTHFAEGLALTFEPLEPPASTAGSKATPATLDERFPSPQPAPGSNALRGRSVGAPGIPGIRPSSTIGHRPASVGLPSET